MLFHEIENTVTNTTNGNTRAGCTMGRLGVLPPNMQRLSCIFIGCIFE